MRFAKVLRFGATRADIGVDLYNLFNTSTPTGFMRDVRLRDQRRDVPATERDRGATVRAVQPEVQLLSVTNGRPGVRASGAMTGGQRLDGLSGSAT